MAKVSECDRLINDENHHRRGFKGGTRLGAPAQAAAAAAEAPRPARDGAICPSNASRGAAPPHGSESGDPGSSPAAATQSGCPQRLAGR